MGETMLFNYSFTDRLDSTLRGSEAELLELQRAAQPRIPVEDIYFAGKYPDAFNFVAKGPGFEYAKMLSIPLAGALIRHIDELAQLTVDADASASGQALTPVTEPFDSTCLQSAMSLSCRRHRASLSVAWPAAAAHRRAQGGSHRPAGRQPRSRDPRRHRPRLCQAGRPAVGSRAPRGARQGRAAWAAGWGPQAPEWQAAELRLTEVIDDIIARRVEDPAWFREAWAGVSARILNAEEADYIAQHFSPPKAASSSAQVIETADRGRDADGLLHVHRSPPLRRARAPSARWLRCRPSGGSASHCKIYDFTAYPDAMRFAGADPGVKYCKMLAIQGIEAINAHYAAVVGETAGALRAHRARSSRTSRSFAAARASQ